MKKKILVTALSLFSAVAMAFGLLACNTKTSEYNDFGDVDSGGMEALPEGNSDSKYDDDSGSDGSQSGDESEGEGSGSSGESGNTPGVTYTNELRYSLNDDKVSYSVTGYGENFGGDVEIPEMYESFPVTSIAASAFYNCTTLTSVVLSNSITSVGVSAFNGCTSLKSVWISDSVTLIGSNAFMDCRALEEIHYNAISVSDLPSNNYVFYDAGADGDGIAVTIGMNVEGIPSYLFCPYSNSHSPKITSVFFADNGMCRNIGGSAFRGYDLLSDIVIPNSVSYIGTAAFYNCTSLVSMSVPFVGSGDLVDAYFGYIFGAPNYSTQVLYIPSSLTDVTVTGNVTVKEYAFYGCTSLVNVTIGEKVTNIGSSAFSGCSSLESLTLPFAGERAAASTASASTLFGYIFGTSSYSGSSAVEQLYSDTLYETYYIPTSLTSVTITSTDVLPGAFNNCGKIPSIILGDGVTSVGDYAFYGCSSLTKVSISEGLVSVGDFAFGCCTSLVTISIPKSVETLGKGLFAYCTSLKHVEFLNESSCVSEDMFYCCKSLEDLSLPENVAEIGSFAYYGCTGLHSITVSGNAVIIGNNAFRDCTSLASVVLDASVSEIGEYAFYNCSSLVSVIIFDGVDSIGSHAFCDCVSVTAIVVPSSVTSIGDSAFSGCSSLESMTLPFVGGNVAVTNASASTLFGYIFGTVSYGGSSVVQQFYSDTLSETYYIPTSLTSVTITGTDVLPGAFNNCDKIPSIILGDGVTSVGDYAFYGCASLTDVSISDSVVSMGDAAFGCCTSLVTISIPKSVKSLGKGFFAYCASLKHVEFLDEGSYVSEGMFYCCESLEDLSLPGSVTEIGSYAYYGCTGLLSITVSGNAVVIGPYAFSDCTSLVAVVLDGTVSEIGKYAFYNCSSLASVTICDGVDSIGSYAFCNCVSITSITVPTSVTTIGDSAFSGCSSLESMTLPFVGGDATAATASASSLFGYIFGTDSYDGGAKTEQLYSIMSSSAVTYYIPVKLTSVTITGGDILFGSFYTCIYLKTVTIEGGVATTIGSRAFLKCTSLASVTVGGSVTSIESSAFSGCTSLTGVYITDIATWCSINFEDETSNPLYYAGNLYLNGNLATDYLVIPDSVTSVGAYAFYGYTFFKSVTVPDSLTHIGINAFYGCTSVSSVYITDVSAWCSIDFGNYYSNPMYYAKTLYLNGNIISGEIVISDGVTTIGTYAFYNCYEILSIKIPDSVKTIGDYAFYGCSSLASVTIPNGVTSIGDYAFYGCSSLASVTIPNGVTSIGDYAFCNCVSFASITIPDNVTAIGSSAFSGCSSIESMTLPFVGGSATDTKASKSTLFGYIFGTDSYNGGVKTQQSYSSNSVTYYYIPAKLTSVTITGGNILYGAFYNCTNLKYVTVGELVTSVGQRAFYNCSSLVSVVIGSGVTSIGSATFNGCSSLESMILPFVGESATATSASSSTLFGYIFGTGSYDGGTATTQKYSDTKESVKYCIPSTLSSVTIVGGNILYGAFYNCSSITTIAIPSSVTSIGSYAFYNCTSLTSIAIPSSVTSIGSYAFWFCTFTSITIPSSVTSIDKHAFYCCRYLEEIYFNATALVDLSSSNDVFYRAGQFGSGITVIIGAGVARIPAYLFYPVNDSSSAPNITTVIFEDDSRCTSIGNYAFGLCISLTSITIPDSVTSIGNYAFYRCTNLTSVMIESSVTSIGNYAFYDCTSLTSVYFLGTSSEWSEITIGDNNSWFTDDATIYYYSEKEPDYDDEYNYWHYDVNGEIVVWVKE